MKYFSKSWYSGVLSDAESSEIQNAYWSEIEAIKSKLSPTILKIATNVSLHDGLVGYITLEHIANKLTIALRCGDLKIGYFDIDIIYWDVDSSTLDSNLLKMIATDVESELLYDEIGLAPSNRYVHRILFYPFREIEIIFDQLKFTLQPKADRELGNNARQYRVFDR